MYLFKTIILYILLICTHLEITTYLWNNNKFVFGALLFSLLYSLFSVLKNKQCNISIQNLLELISVFLINIINTYFIHSNILSGISLTLGSYFILKTVIGKQYTTQILWAVIFIILRLSVKDYFQIFLGVPLRLISANTIEHIFKILHIDSISQNTILIFENNITNIDYPCSGSSLIYYLLLFMVLICLIKNIRLNIKLILKMCLTIIIASILNIGRIFILTLLSINENLIYIAEKIHTPLGIFNFVCICVLFYFLINISNQKEYPEQNNNYIKYHIVIIILSILAMPVFFAKEKYTDKIKEYKFIQSPYINLPVSNIEESLFKKYGAEVQKYTDGKQITIKIKSDSWQAVHNPELCLRNQDFTIINSKTVFIDGKQMKHLTTDKGDVYYYYTNGKITTDDYYKRVFDSIFSKDKTWELVLYYMVSLEK